MYLLLETADTELGDLYIYIYIYIYIYETLTLNHNIYYKQLMLTEVKVQKVNKNTPLAT